MDAAWFELASLVLASALMYHVVRWKLLGRAGREEALRGIEQTVVAAALVGVAFSLMYLISIGIDVYLQYSGVNPNLLSLFKQGDFVEALDGAGSVFKEIYDVSKDYLWWYFAAVSGSGIFMLTQPISMAASIALSPAITLIGSVFAMSAAFAAFTKMLTPFAGALAGMGAVLVAHDRGRNLGSLLLAISTAAPAVLVATADAVSPLLDSYKPWLGGFEITLRVLSGTIVDKAWAAAELAVYLAVAASLLTSLTYAVSRIFDYAGSHLSIE